MAKRADSAADHFRPLLDADVIAAATAPQSAQKVVLVEPSRDVSTRQAQDISRFSEPIERGTSERSISKYQVNSASTAAEYAIEKVGLEKKVLLTKTEGRAIERLVGSLGTKLNAQVKSSHVIRALVQLLLNAESEIIQRAAERGTVLRPSNADTHALQRFDREIAMLIGAAISDAGPLRE